MRRTFHHLLAGACLSGLLAGAALEKSGANETPSKKPYPFTRAEVEQWVDAKGVLLVDAKSRRVLFERGATQQFPPASTTKLMTALLVMELKGAEGSVTVQAADTRVQPSSVPLVAGETVRVRDALATMLIGSDNDAALLLARYAAGSVEAFVERMNERARELGCTGTRFANPHGLTAPEMVTTARDLHRIFVQAISNPTVRELSQLREFTLKTKRGVQVVKSHNKLLTRYPGMGPGKTGWTRASQHTYAAAATRDGHEVHVIILNSADKWRDASVLLDYAFHTLAKEEEPEQTAGLWKARGVQEGAGL